MPTRAFHDVIRIHFDRSKISVPEMRVSRFKFFPSSLFHVFARLLSKLPFIDPSNGITACLSSQMKGIAIVRRHADTIFVLYAIDP